MTKDEYMQKVLVEVSLVLKMTNPIDIINNIAERNKDLKTLTVQQQYLLGAILGSMLHEAYCESRKLDKPNEQGLPNNPRIKKLTEDIDQEFVNSVIMSGRINGVTLFVQDGILCMDIANTPFAQLSPHWQKDNFMAGCAATRSVISNWDGLTHDNDKIREFVTVAVANAIHEAWIARENIYFDQQGDQIYTNEELATAYINLLKNEQDKDLLHYQMALNLITMLREKMKEKNAQKTTNKPDESQPGDN